MVVVGFCRPFLRGEPFFDLRLLNVYNDAWPEIPGEEFKEVAQVMLSDGASSVYGLEIGDALIHRDPAQRFVRLIGHVKLGGQKQFIGGHNRQSSRQQFSALSHFQTDGLQRFHCLAEIVAKIVAGDDPAVFSFSSGEEFTDVFGLFPCRRLRSSHVADALAGCVIGDDEPRIVLAGDLDRDPKVLNFNDAFVLHGNQEQDFSWLPRLGWH